MKECERARGGKAVKLIMMKMTPMIGTKTSSLGQPCSLLFSSRTLNPTSCLEGTVTIILIILISMLILDVQDDKKAATRGSDYLLVADELVFNRAR